MIPVAWFVQRFSSISSYLKTFTAFTDCESEAKDLKGSHLRHQWTLGHVAGMVPHAVPVAVEVSPPATARWWHLGTLFGVEKGESYLS